MRRVSFGLMVGMMLAIRWGCSLYVAKRLCCWELQRRRMQILRHHDISIRRDRVAQFLAFLLAYLQYLCARTESHRALHVHLLKG